MMLLGTIDFNPLPRNESKQESNYDTKYRMSLIVASVDNLAARGIVRHRRCHGILRSKMLSLGVK
jgi:hypothetical protein